MTITFQQLQYFLAAVEHGSLSAAAEAQYIAQPSLSEQVRRLENQLGVSLFIRTNRRLVLTEAAHMLLPHAQRALAAVRAAEDSVQPVRTMTGGTVSFGTFSIAHHLLYEDVVSDFRSEFPMVRLRLLGLHSSDVASRIRDGELEAGIVALPVDDRGLHVRDVDWVSEAVYFSADAARVREPITAERLGERNLILPEARWGLVDTTRRQLAVRAQNAGVQMEPVIEVESPSAALALAARGLGDTIASYSLAHRLGWTRDLAWVPLSPPLHETFACITLRDAHLSPATEALIGIIRARLRALPLPDAPKRT